MRIQIHIRDLLGLHEGRLGYRGSREPSKENIQHFKQYFSLLLCVIFTHLDHDSDPHCSNAMRNRIKLTKIKIEPCGFETTTLDAVFLVSGIFSLSGWLFCELPILFKLEL